MKQAFMKKVSAMNKSSKPTQYKVIPLQKGSIEKISQGIQKDGLVSLFKVNAVARHAAIAGGKPEDAVQDYLSKVAGPRTLDFTRKRIKTYRDPKKIGSNSRFNSALEITQSNTPIPMWKQRKNPKTS